MALVWDVRDVHTAANEREFALTNKEAIKNPPGTAPPPRQTTWAAMVGPDQLHRGYALGRKLTRAELKRFVEKNLLTIDRKRR